MPRDRAARWLDAAIVAALCVVAGRTTAALWRFATTARELPLWDEAKYGLDGARLAAALADLDLVRFARLVYDLDVWPPLFPLAESAVFLAAGNGFGVARGLVAALYFGTVLAAFWAGREIAPQSPGVAASAAALVLASPFVQLFAAHVMLELPGALLYLLALGAYLRFLRTAERGALVATGLFTAGLFLTKYNYALLWLVPLAASEAWIAYGGPRSALHAGVALARRFDLRRPWHVFVALFLVGLAAIAVSGGGTLVVAGNELSVTSIGNPLYLLLVIAAARVVRRPRRAWHRWTRWQRGLEERHRVLLWTVVVPAALWLALPPHLQSFLDFVENRSSGPPLASAAALLYYPRRFVEEYHLTPVLGIAVLALAVAALAGIRQAAPGARVVLLALVVGLTTTTLHPYKEPRFFFVVAPVVWLAAAWKGVAIAEGAASRLQAVARAAARSRPVQRASVRRWTSAAVGLAALVSIARVPTPAPGVREAFARYTVPASTAALVDRVVELAAERPTLVLGTWNQASPTLLEWRFRQRPPPASAPPDVVIPTHQARSTERVTRRLRSQDAPAQVVVIDVEPRDAPSPEWMAAYTAETAWLEPVRLDLAKGAVPYALAGDEVFSGTGYRLRVYGAVSSAPKPVATGVE